MSLTNSLAVKDEIYFCQEDFAQSEPIRFDISEAMQWIYP